MHNACHLLLPGKGAVGALALLLLFLTACGPQLGDLQKGESGRVIAASNGDTLELDSGLRVFLAEIDAPRGEQDYAAQAQAELEALTLHRPVRLAYGGTPRWTPRPREGSPGEPQPETAIAHVFVQSEGGRWFWLQHELVTRGAAFVRPRRDNHARSAELIAIEAAARAADRGLWDERAWRLLTAEAAAQAALTYAQNCTRGDAPYRLIEARIESADVFDTRATLRVDAGDGAPFDLVLFGDNFTNWDGPDLAQLAGARVAARGPLGVYRDAPQLCLEDARALAPEPATP